MSFRVVHLIGLTLHVSVLPLAILIAGCHLPGGQQDLRWQATDAKSAAVALQPGGFEGSVKVHVAGRPLDYEDSDGHKYPILNFDVSVVLVSPGRDAGIGSAMGDILPTGMRIDVDGISKAERDTPRTGAPTQPCISPAATPLFPRSSGVWDNWALRCDNLKLCERTLGVTFVVTPFSESMGTIDRMVTVRVDLQGGHIAGMPDNDSLTLSDITVGPQVPPRLDPATFCD